MANVLIVIYLLIALALIAVILVQRSEGGALGIGGNTNFSTTRSSANLLTRTTGILAALFFATAIGLTVLNEIDRGSQNILENASKTAAEQPGSVLDALNQLQGDNSGLAVPAAPADAAPATGTAPSGGTGDLPVPDAPAPANTGTGGN